MVFIFDNIYLTSTSQEAKHSVIPTPMQKCKDLFSKDFPPTEISYILTKKILDFCWPGIEGMNSPTSGPYPDCYSSVEKMIFFFSRQNPDPPPQKKLDLLPL